MRRNVIQDNNNRECVSPECTTGASLLAKVSKVATQKVSQTSLSTFLLACMAGLFIGFGSLFYLTFTADSSLSFAIKKLGGGLCFCLGLTLVILCGAELFTGNSLMVVGLLNKKIKFKEMLKNWIIVLFGNLIGSLVLVMLVYLSQVATISAGENRIADNILTIASNKINLDWWTIFFRAILCNILVCLAVYIAYAGKSVADKVLGIFLPIAGFVTCGFEHCVANMFFLPMGLVCDSASLNLQGILWNLSASIPGNIVGGSIFVGLIYWLIYSKKLKMFEY